MTYTIEAESSRISDAHRHRPAPARATHRRDEPMTAPLQCEMTDDCKAKVTMLEDKGYIYCTDHGIARRYWHRVRKLRPHELRRLQRGEQIKHY